MNAKKDSFGAFTDEGGEICLERSKYKQTDQPGILDIALWYQPPVQCAYHAGLVVRLEDIPIVMSRLGRGNDRSVKELPAKKVMAEMGCDDADTVIRYYTKTPDTV